MKKIFFFFFILLMVSLQLINAQNPVLWGTTYYGGSNSLGTIFKINGDGNCFDTIYSFKMTSGYYPEGGTLLLGTNGNLYGLTRNGGTFGYGVLFSLDTTTGTFSDLHDFDSASGSIPMGCLIRANDGKFYGMTFAGGSNNGGVIFSFDRSGNTYSKLYDFDLTTGSNSYGTLMQANNNKLYGMTYSGGTNVNYGVIFSFDLATDLYTVVHNFDNINGQHPYGRLLQANNGKLYGMTYWGGSNGTGVLFSIDTTNNFFTKLYDLNPSSGDYPFGSLIQASDGNLYGMTSHGGDTTLDNGLGFGVLFSFNIIDSIYTTLFDFNLSSGAAPNGSLFQADNGKLYGMTGSGGDSILSDGTIFSWDISSNTYSKLHDFDNIEGKLPDGDLIQVDSSVIDLCEPTDIKPINQNQFSIFPNPTSGEINVTSEKNMDEIKVTNLLGQIVYDTKLGQAHSGFEIKTEGIYFVTIISFNELSTFKIMVSN